MYINILSKLISSKNCKEKKRKTIEKENEKIYYDLNMMQVAVKQFAVFSVQ